METNPLVTIIIPVFNRSTMLREAIDSTLAQSYRPLEVVIVDDGSTDETPRVAHQLVEADPQTIRYVQQQNAGPGAARNKGFEQSKGEFIQYLDSDDLLDTKKIELQVKALQAQPEAGVAYCTTLRKNLATGEARTWARTAEEIERIFPDFLIERGWHTTSPLWRRSLCEAIGPWGDFRCMEDWEHDLRAGMLGAKPVHVPEPLVVVRDHEGPRASGLVTGFTPEFTRDFFRAHRSIWLQMKQAKLNDWQYLEAFSHKMFWISRMCGERNLITEAEEALEFAREMIKNHRISPKIYVFQSLVRLFGWSVTVTISENFYRFLTRFENLKVFSAK